MKHFLLPTALVLALVGCGGAAEKKDDPSAAAPGNQAATQPAPLPHSDRKDDPTVLLPGDPPLTQGMMDRDIDVWEWMLDLRLTEQQRAQWQKRWMDGWKKKDDKGKAEQLTDVKHNGAYWEGLAKLSETQRNLERLRLQALDLATLRKSPDELDTWMASLYEEAHKPGGERNAILVASDPPLTQDMVDLYRTAMDYLLDLQMTDRQRDEYRRLFIEDWKKHNPKEWAKNIESWRKPLSLRPYARRVWRAGERPPSLDRLPKSDAGSDAWLLAAYEAAHKPGSERNPILAAGEPPLTREVVDQYCVMVEGVLDFSISGGLTAQQRQDLEDLLVKDWKGMDRSAREDFLQTLQKWPGQARLLVQLRAAPASDQRSQYLLEIHNKEVEKLTAKLKAQQEGYEFIKDLYRVHWTYNPWTHEYEFDGP